MARMQAPTTNPEVWYVRQVCETKRGALSRRKVFRRQVDKKEEEMYADMGNDEDFFERKENVEKKEMGVRTGEKRIFCDVETGEKDMSATTDRTWPNAWGRKQKREESWKR